MLVSTVGLALYLQSRNLSDCSVGGHALAAQQIHDVLHYWFVYDGDVPQNNMKIWYGFSAETDAEIRRKFLPLIEEAIAGGLRDWEQTPRGLLAKILLLDQFTRNVYRRQANAFAGDKEAVRLTKKALKEHKGEFHPLEMSFVIMPLMHSEDLADQLECVRVTRKLVEESKGTPAEELFSQALKYAEDHRDVVAKFGRFPHRNEALGRKSTPEEVEYLRSANRYGQ